MKPTNLSSHLLSSLLLTALCLTVVWRSTEAQFLFTYEINQEDDSRAPKSSLFDPSSFRIVTPSQLQSSYQKLSTQPIEVAPASGGDDPSESGPTNDGQQVARSGEQVNAALTSRLMPNIDESPDAASSAQSTGASSLLKQTSAALQSFAELFSLSPSSSPSPLGGSLHPVAGQLNQQAEARSLHEHWTQQQQKSHQQLASPSGQQHQQQSLANAALNSFTTTPTSNQVQQVASQQQQSPQASYWLTANPLNSADGSYLVQIKQAQEQQQQQVSSPASNVVDNLLSIAHRPSATSAIGSHSGATGRSTRQSAQSSFLATPTSYYPNPVESSTRVSTSLHSVHAGAHRAVPLDHFGAPAAPAPIPQQQQRAAASFVHTTAPSRFVQRELPDSAGQQLQPPANAPEHYAPQSMGVGVAPAGRPVHKSAEESLISFRHQQQQQHDQQGALFAAQHQLANHLQQQLPANPNLPSSSQGNHFAQPAQQVPQTFHKQPVEASRLGAEIPKVSPQIYESFLLQQRDQHEKHMELLKQQQELNRLLEQKHKQQEAEAKRRRKKEELDKEARKKVAREQEAARKLKLEQEERESLRRRRDEEDRKRQAEERRYRDYLEAREREKREREAAQQLKRQAEAEEEQRQRARKAAEQEASEAAERRRISEQATLLQEKRKRDEEAAKYANYLRQQDELKKLIELKQKEDEAQQQRRRQVAAVQQQQQHEQPQQIQKQKHSQSSRANRLAAEHRERAQSSAAAASAGQWGTPLRLRGQVSSAAAAAAATTTSESPVARLTGPTTAAAVLTSEPTTLPSAEPKAKQRGRHVVMVRQKLRNSGVDDKLIRQKIPNYTGPGQYGLYRGSNDSFANDLAALLDSVTLPVSSSTSTPAPSSTSTGASAPSDAHYEPAARRLESVTPSSLSSSLSPLLNQAQQQQQPSSTLPSSVNEQPSEPFFDDDVPRRPARGLSQVAQRRQQQSQAQSSSHLATQQLAVASSRQQASRFNESAQATSGGRSAHIGLASLPPDSDNDGIPGRAGIEYPTLSAVPPTSFSCSKQPLNGYYADTETACQVVHLCQAGTQSSILCPNGTIFNQEKFSCQWWYEVNCSRAPNFYQLNDNLYKATTLPSDDSQSASDNKRKARNKERGANSLSS